MSTHNVDKDGGKDGAGDGAAVLGRRVVVAADKLLVAAAVHKRQHREDDNGKGGHDGATRGAQENKKLASGSSIPAPVAGEEFGFVVLSMSSEQRELELFRDLPGPSVASADDGLHAGLRGGCACDGVYSRKGQAGGIRSGSWMRAGRRKSVELNDG